MPDPAVRRARHTPRGAPWRSARSLSSSRRGEPSLVPPCRYPPSRRLRPPTEALGTGESLQRISSICRSVAPGSPSQPRRGAPYSSSGGSSWFASLPLLLPSSGFPCRANFGSLLGGTHRQNYLLGVPIFLEGYLEEEWVRQGHVRWRSASPRCESLRQACGRWSPGGRLQCGG